MLNETISIETKGTEWKGLFEEQTQLYLNDVFEKRPIPVALRSRVICELRIYLGLLLGAKVQEHYTEEVALRVIQEYMRDIHDTVTWLGMSYQDVVQLTADRHDFYLAGLFDETNGEAFLRHIGLQWFQFPLQTIEDDLRPSDYDFSCYYSDIPLVSHILFELTPKVVQSMVDGFKPQ
ncbi:hypothetical protein KO507_19440 [Gilvimarinus agarilyticus]|uniref:hypothetical protein n=1 Tax=Reichenbachiella agariperforans TaxID=156994 RepID=UPI001C081903|nr:hypothetical protein [Reichenbachiella agariperforans]MBU2887948.1 hypothetical protein [Gilvimarinus agarilyticus]MBU2913396.1 hypothetical protein [Reichenbachiella agariperforans]